MNANVISLPAELAARIEALAESKGTTVHDYVLAALEERLEQEHLSTDLEELAQRRFTQLVETGLAVPWSEMRQYMLDRAAGKSPARPIARRFPEADALKRLYSKKSD